MILEGIVALIVRAGSGLQAITANRIYPISLPENIGASVASAPAMTYQIVGGSSQPNQSTSGPQKLRVQFDCYGATASVAYGVREALRLLLNGYRGVLSDGTHLKAAFWIAPIDHFENDARQFRCACEFYFYFNFTS